MSRPKSDRPSYCRHKRTGRAFVTIDGKQRTLPGPYNSAANREREAGWATVGSRTPAPSAEFPARRRQPNT